MDLGKNKLSKTLLVKLNNADGTPLVSDGENPEQMTITVLSPHTKEYLRNAFQLGKSLGKTTKGKVAEDYEFEDIELIRSERMELLANVTTDAKLFIDGKWALFSTELIKKIYMDEDLHFIPTQVSEVVTKNENFIKS